MLNFRFECRLRKETCFGKSVFKSRKNSLEMILNWTIKISQDFFFFTKIYIFIYEDSIFDDCGKVSFLSSPLSVLNSPLEVSHKLLIDRSHIRPEYPTGIFFCFFPPHLFEKVSLLYQMHFKLAIFPNGMLF